MSVSRSTEIERKYSVPDGAELPRLDGLAEGVRAEAQPVAELDAVYVDTADRALSAARIAVRRRSGGHDAGWHVKLQAAAGRTELHAPVDPADPDRVPDGFEAALRSRVRGRPLEPIARIRTERHAVVVTAPDGGQVEVVDDHVHATDVAAGVVRTWREWEAEQTGPEAASAALLDRVDAVLAAAGATPSASPAKLAQALGQDGRHGRAKAPEQAGPLLTAAVERQARELHALLMGLQLDGDPDGEVVHDLRRTIRRITSLTALGPVAGSSGARVRERLRRLSHELGTARDPLVAAGFAEELLREVPSDAPGRDAAVGALVDGPRASAAARTAALVTALNERPALEAFAALDGFVADGPDAQRSPRVLVRLAKRSLRRAAKRGRHAGRDLDALHAARRAAKRARLVVEACADLGLVAPGSGLAKRARAAKVVQEELGEHRDLELLLGGLPAAAAAVTAGGGDAYAIGFLARIVGTRAAKRLRRARRSLRRLG